MTDINEIQHEYTSIMHAYYKLVLTPLLERGQGLDKDTISMTKSDLEWIVNDPQFKDLPLKWRNAYMTLKTFIETLEKAEEFEISSHEEVLKSLISLESCCNHYSDYISFRGINSFCREDRYKTNSVIKKAERNLGKSPLLDSAIGMLEICKRCPYI